MIEVLVIGKKSLPRVLRMFSQKDLVSKQNSPILKYYFKENDIDFSVTVALEDQLDVVMHGKTYNHIYTTPDEYVGKAMKLSLVILLNDPKSEIHLRMESDEPIPY